MEETECEEVFYVAKIGGQWVDVYFDNHEEMLDFAIKNKDVEVINKYFEKDGKPLGSLQFEFERRENSKQ